MTSLSPATAERAAAGERAAVLSGVLCYLMWGLLPLYFMAAQKVGATSLEIVAHRSFWSVFWALGLVLLSRQGRQTVTALTSPRTLVGLMASSVAIGVNWSVFVWGVNNHHNLEVSLGYFLTPLINMALGAALFRERISRVAWVAIALAGLGVVVQTAALGRIPYVGLGLAVSFCIYGVIRKRVAADAQTGVFVECLFLAPFGLAYGLWLQRSGGGHFGGGAWITTLLLLTGPITVAPLALFSWAARRMPLSTLAFIQFIGPSAQFVIGVVTGEPLQPARALSFAFIWAGVAVFLWGAWRATRAAAAQSAS